MKRVNGGFPSLKKIRLLAVDVDGTLTDGAMYFGADGEVMKRFDTRDGHGMVHLMRSGIEVAFITSENSPIVSARARKLGVRRVYLGCKDKLPQLRSLCGEMGLTLEQVAYVGDDINDTDCLREAGFSACPCDAVDGISELTDYTCRRGGGRGAVREVCNMILSAIGANKEDGYAGLRTHRR